MSWMRWANVAGLVLVALMAVFLWGHSRKQDERIRALRVELDSVQIHFPTWLRSELSATEERIIERIDALLAQR